MNVLTSCSSPETGRNHVDDEGIPISHVALSHVSGNSSTTVGKRTQMWENWPVCVFADRAAARAHSDPVPGLAGSRRSWWLHRFPRLCGSCSVQTGGAGPAHGGALQVRLSFLSLPKGNKLLLNATVDYFKCFHSDFYSLCWFIWQLFSWLFG